MQEEFKTGDFIGDYQVISRIGKGGMGYIYLGQHHYLKKRFALKVLPPSLSTNAAFADIFLSEAQTLCNLKHPNIIEIYNFGLHGSSHFLVMEYASGGDLEQYAHAQGGFVSEGELRSILTDVLKGLAHAHSMGIIHRDLKPENFLLDENGSVKISDFGIARLKVDALGEEQVGSGRSQTFLALEESQRELSGSYTGGTEGYIAPEVVAGAMADERSDLYAIGIIMYRLLTGQKPGPMLQPISELVPGINPHWDTLVSYLLAADPEQRYQSAEDLIYEIEHLDERVVAKGLRPLSDAEKANIKQPTKKSVVTPKKGKKPKAKPPKPIKQKSSGTGTGGIFKLLIPLFALLALAGGGYYAWQQGLLDDLLGKHKATPQTGDTESTSEAPPASRPPMSSKGTLNTQSPAKAPAGPNLLQNGSFDAGDSHWQSAGEAVSFAVVPVKQARDGSQAARLEQGRITQILKSPAGKTLSFHAYGRSAEQARGARAGLYLKIKYKDGSSEEARLMWQLSDRWQALSARLDLAALNASKPLASLEVGLWAGDNTAEFDQVRLGEVKQ